MTTFVRASRSAELPSSGNLSLSEQSQLTVRDAPDWALTLSENLTKKALYENGVETAYSWLVVGAGAVLLGVGVFAAIGAGYHTQLERGKAKRKSQHPMWQ
jgi:hypothetical protein